ncbi:MAG: glycosyltransferase family 39 protein [Myxococcota bacterium]
MSGAPAARALVAALGAFAFVQAGRLRLSYADTWDYWNDARALLGEPGVSFYRVHAPLEGALLTPLVATIDRDGLGPWVGPHLLHAALATLTLLAVYAWLRPLVGSRAAALGLLVFAATRLFVRYAPHALVDVPAAGWVAATFAAWDRAETARRPRAQLGWALATGAALAAGMLHKYTLLALPGALGAAGLVRLVLEPDRRARLLRGLVAGGSAIALFALGFGATFLRVEGAVSLATFESVLDQARHMVEAWGVEAPDDYLSMALVVASPLAYMLAALGLLAALRGGPRVRRALPGLLWLPLLGGLIAFRVEHNEARYLLPLFPSVALAAALGARSLAPLLRRIPRPRRARARAFAWGATLLLLVLPAADQVRRDLHPAFARPTQPALVEVLRQALLPDSSLGWHGHPLPLVTTTEPANPLIPEDEFFDTVHIAHPLLRAMTGRDVDGRWGRPDPVRRLLRVVRSDVDLILRGPTGSIYAPVLAAGVDAPPHLELWLRNRWRFAGPGTHGGLQLDEDGWLRAVDPSPGLFGPRVRAAGGEREDVALRIGGDPVSPRRRHHVGRALEEAGPDGLLVERVERLRLPILWE